MRYVPSDEVRPVKVAGRTYTDGTWAIIGDDGKVVATHEHVGHLLPDLRQLEICSAQAFLARFDAAAGVFRRAMPPFDEVETEDQA